MSIATYDFASLTYDSASTDYDGGGVGLSNMPVVGVFISFTDGPYVVEPTWVEVTQYVRDINVRRGRGNDLQQFPTGSATVTLDNRTRIFDPFNTAGTYYGNLKPRRQIKIVGQYAGVTYPIFRGFIAGWPVQYAEGGKDSTVDIDCFDALGLLAADTMPNDLPDYYMRQASPANYWKCNDGNSSTVLAEQIVGSTSQLSAVSGTPPFVETEPLAQGLQGRSASIQFYEGTITSSATTYGFCCWVRTNPPNSVQPSIVSIQNGSTLWRLVQSTSSLYVELLGSSTFSQRIYTIDTSFRQQLGQAFHVAVYGENPPRIFINNVQVTYATTSPGAATAGFAYRASVQLAEIAEFGFFTTIPTNAQMTNIYNAGVARYTQSALDRFTLLSSFTSFPSALISSPSSTNVNVSDFTSNRLILQEMQSNNDAENGELYVSNAGVLSFVNRNYWAANARSNTSQVSFTDTGTGVYYDHASIGMAYDADVARNEVTVGFTSGGNTVSVDTTSVASIGVASESVSTYIATSAEAKTLADYLVSIYKNPKLRIEPFVVKGQRNPTYDWPRLLALELLDRFTFVRTPSTGSAISQDMLLQSIEHRITPGTWETVVNGSARFTGWFTIGTSLIGGTDVLL